jgi:hypothetical protein
MPNLTEPIQREADKSTAPGGENASAMTELDSSSDKTFEKMRSSPRVTFKCNQRIAPLHKDLPPQKDEYFNVECNDISKGGISFYLKRPPGCERFAVVLGQKPNITTLIGRVASTREVTHNGERMFLVGCQFVGRLEL